MGKILASVACNLDQHLLQASLPLLEQEQVDAIEWSFDSLYQHRNIPNWFVELIRAFSDEDRLIGHGVFFSIFSGKWHQEQTDWLNRLKKMATQFKFDHITEHFGFMTGKDFHKGAPISIPYNKSTVRIGQDRLHRIYDVVRCPIGLENLAFAYSIEEVNRHGAFLEELLQPINGFIILDLHNIYCQVHNFNIDFHDLLQLYPLNRVREIHISGGSWENVSSTNRPIRRDTHDNGVPKIVFDFLERAIVLCPNLKYVVLEQLGSGLKSINKQKQFRSDFLLMKGIIDKVNNKEQIDHVLNFIPFHLSPLNHSPIEDQKLHQQQQTLSDILENAKHYHEAMTKLEQSSLANTDWKIEHWSNHMLETSIAIAQKWKDGF